ncbi:MAG: hypothetical protein R3240_00710 [Gammaproteobacteria bacterium]|nr:hypothetical protein [Gammaproteobacteria bacterium]
MNLAFYHESLRNLGCVVCRTIHDIEIHHTLSGSMSEHGINVGKGQKNNNWLVIPLCKNHHTGNEAIHRGVKTWEAKHGTQLEFLKTLSEFFGIDVFEKAGYKYDSELDRYYK